MNTKYSLRGSLEPQYPFKKLIEDLEVSGMKVRIQRCTLEIGFDNEADETKAYDVVNLMTQIWSLEHSIKITIDLSQKYCVRQDGGRDIAIVMSDVVKMQDFLKVNQMPISGTAQIVKQDLFDSSAFKSNIPLLKKCLTNYSLRKSLNHFHEEVLDSKRPLYGVYKAIEELCLAIGGRDKLALLVNQPVKYIDDLMQTSQTMRHARTNARRLITDDECRQRAKELIKAYANST